MDTPFKTPDWTGPLDLEERLRAIPADAQVRGIFFRSAVGLARSKAGKSAGRGEYAALSFYPLRELLQVLVECGHLVYPDLPPREGLRRLGHHLVPALRDVPAGTFLFSVAGGDVQRALGLVSRAYQMLSATRATLRECAAGHAVVELRSAWTFPAWYHVGVLEGGAQSYGKHAEASVRVHGLGDVDVRLQWR